MSSILTNTSALVALQTLKAVNKGLGKVQNEISTGMKVATAKDNSSSWAIASTMNSDVGSLKKLGESLTSASAMVGVARTAAEQIADILRQIQEKVVQAQNPEADVTKLTPTSPRSPRRSPRSPVRRSTTASTSSTPGDRRDRDRLDHARGRRGRLTQQTFSTGVADLAAVADGDLGMARHLGRRARSTTSTRSSTR
jgi:flagellin